MSIRAGLILEARRTSAPAHETNPSSASETGADCGVGGVPQIVTRHACSPRGEAPLYANRNVLVSYLSMLSSIQTLPLMDVIVSTARWAAIPISVTFMYGDTNRLGESY
jgi:hypothetical protein